MSTTLAVPAPVAVNTHPVPLTIEYVVSHLERLLRHRIRSFHLRDSEDDCYQNVILGLITPSTKLGTTYLERYDPSRGSALHYVLMFCTQQMMKLHAKQKGVGIPVEITVGTPLSSGIQDSLGVHEGELENAPWAQTDAESTIRTPADLRKFLAGTRHVLAHSYSASGEPRSTVYMLELMLWGNLTVTEVAGRLQISTAEVHRRLKTLRVEPRLRQLFPHLGVA